MEDHKQIEASANPAGAAEGRAVYAVVEAYERALNARDVDAIAELYGRNGVSRWNERGTAGSPDQIRAQYLAYFASRQFSTIVAYDGITINGNWASVRTKHHVGSSAQKLPAPAGHVRREVFILARTGDSWKIVLHTFNSNSRLQTPNTLTIPVVSEAPHTDVRTMAR